MGIPGCGKSSVFRELASILGAKAFHEPEEDKWDAAVRERDVCGRFTAVTWFRAQRVPQLYQADALRKSGHIALVDSYFDKLIALYLGRPGMEWLIDPSDTYFSVISEMAALDYKELPNADFLVLFRVAKETWQMFLKLRGRDLDRNEQFRSSFNTQEDFARAARHYCDEHGAQLIDFPQVVSSPRDAAARLSQILRDAGLQL